MATNVHGRRALVSSREAREFKVPVDLKGKGKSINEYFGENVYDFKAAKDIPDDVKEEIAEVASSGKPLKIEHAKLIAQSVTEWAINKGATHFCHWFHPLTGNTAEKHDSFLSFNKEGKAVERLSASQLMQGEPDASSFPNGGARTTFEARGYTAWDISSPMFLKSGTNGKVLCIPTAFVSYTGEALDIKTPMLRSITKLGNEAVKFLELVGEKNVKNVTVTCGAEQEYFLIDKALFVERKDLVMCERTLFGSASAKNQQLDDHYFGTVPTRVLAFMQELDLELHKLGIPSKTRHNEVAPGQFELAPIFTAANQATDHNQMIMALIKEIANRHNFEALLHEKPFGGINGSGKHLNWSLASDTGINFLEPGKKPENNLKFLTFLSVVCEAVYRHSDFLRTAIASHGNDHRLGAAEAPPSIISIFLGDALTSILKNISEGSELEVSEKETMEVAEQLAALVKDTGDRNRTSPFAFTGNKFEFRALGSSTSIGFPTTVLNTAVYEVLAETNLMIEEELGAGKKINDVLRGVIKRWYSSSEKVVFNGDGYSDEWVQEAEKRGLPNLKTTPDALKTFKDKEACAFFINSEVLSEAELEMRHNILVERYNIHREIEVNTLIDMVAQDILPASMSYKQELAATINEAKQCNLDTWLEERVYKFISETSKSIYEKHEILRDTMEKYAELDDEKKSHELAYKIMPITEELSDLIGLIEKNIANEHWDLPKYYEMLFIK